MKDLKERKENALKEDKTMIKRYVKGNEVIAEIEERERGYYIVFTPNTCPCTCGVFDTLEEAMDTVKRLRPLADLCE